MKLMINVTARDIKLGRESKGDRPSSCPVNRAARRHEALAGCTTGMWTIVGADYSSYRLPERAHAFIRAFDAGLPVEPFSFLLEV